MAGYIGKSQGVTQVDGYNRTEADDRYVNASGDTMTGALALPSGGLNVGSGQLAVNASGNVLVGTPTSIQKLSMQRNTSIGWVNAADNGSDQIIYADSASNINFYTNSTHRMQIDSAGRVTMPYQPSFKVWNSTGTTYLGVLLPNQVSHDTGNNFNTSLGRFTAPVAGVYLFRCDFRQPSTGSGYLDIKASDGQAIRVEEPSTGNLYHHSCVALFKLNANDYVWLQSGGSVGQRWDTNAINSFSGVLIG